MSDKTWITGEFVETVQLQVVCRTLINKLAPNATEISMEHLEAYGSLDKALQVFYEDSIREVVDKTREALRRKGETEIKEGVLRNWFEKKLITPAHTRGLAYRGTTHTEGLINEAVDVLDQAHIIREERRGSGRWYELSHDRFIDPILTSNKEWLLQYSGAAKLRQWLEERATRWNQAQDETALLSENELAEAERWVASAEASELGYDRSVTNLIQASRTNVKTKRVQRELEVESAARLARSARRFKWASVGLAVMFLFSVATTFFAADQWRKARANFHLAEEQKGVVEKSRADAVKWANGELEAKKEAERQARAAQEATREADERARQAAKARQEAENARGQLRGALKKAQDRADEAERARRTDRLSREAFRLSRRPESQGDAIDQFGAAIKVYEKTGDRDAQADSYLNQGQVYKDMGEPERAEDSFNKALQLYRHEPADPLKQANTLNNIGLIYSSSSGSADSSATEGSEEALATAKTKFYTALIIYRALKDVFGEAATLTNIGDVQLAMNAKDDRRRAEEYYQQAVDIYENHIDKKSDSREKSLKAMAVMLMSLGDKSSLLADSDDSTNPYYRILFYQQALESYTQLGDEPGMAMAYTRMGDAAEEFLETAEGDDRGAIEAMVLDGYTKAAQLYKEKHDAIGEAGAHLRLGDYYRGVADREKWRKAISEYQQASDIYRSVGDRAGQVRAHRLLYEFYSKSSEPGDKPKAIEALLLMNDLYKSLENVRGQSDTLLKLGALHESLQARNEAKKAFDDALSFYITSGDKKTQADIMREIGKIYAASKDKSGVEIAVRRLNDAAAIYSETNSIETLAATYDKLAEIHSQSPWRLKFSTDEATQWYLQAVKYYEMEADLYRSKGTKSDPLKVAKILRFIASVYRDRLDDKAKALESLNQSLTLYEEAKNYSGARAVKLEIANLTKQPVPQTKQ
jgi:tetratricopeptide (TPR) repeat protein